MPIQIINTGTVPNDDTGDTARAAFLKTNANVQDLDARLTVTQDAASSAQATASAAIPASHRGAAGGVAPLGSDSKVPAAYLPGYVDDVLEFATLVDFPTEGDAGKLYVALDTNLVYRWGGSAYVEISPSPGSTDAVPEGAIHKYFTEERAQQALAATVSNLEASVQQAQEDATAAGDAAAEAARKDANLSDLTDAGQARDNLGLGNAALADVVGLVANGAIIERGSNANGEYVRFADGTQIVFGRVEGVNIDVPFGGVYRSAPISTPSPAAFADSTVSLLNTGYASDISSSNIWAATRLSGGGFNTTAFYFQAISGRTINTVIIGRWA